MIYYSGSRAKNPNARRSAYNGAYSINPTKGTDQTVPDPKCFLWIEHKFKQKKGDVLRCCRCGKTRHEVTKERAGGYY